MRETLSRLSTRLRTEVAEFARFTPSDRLWQMPLASSVAMGAPLFVAAWTGRMDRGLAGSLAGLVFLYVLGTPLHHRMVALMACAFGMIACFSIGLLCQPWPALVLPVMALVAVLVTMLCRFYMVPPPGSLFFVMAAAIGAYTPAPRPELFVLIGVFSLSALFACVVAFIYSLVTLRLRAPTPVPRLPSPSFDFVVFDSVVIGVFVGLSLVIAHALALERPYWVPVSCLAVIQGASLRAIWNRQLQRTMGTVAGLALAWVLLSLPHSLWSIAVTMMSLSFFVELLVVRQYATAVIFITPLTILLADAARLGQTPASVLMQARLVDTALGCIVGLIGGICLYSVGFRDTFSEPMRKLVPRRFRQPRQSDD